MKQLDFSDAESASIEAIAKLSLLLDHLDRKAVQISPEDSLASNIVGGQICLVSESLTAVQRLSEYIMQANDGN